VGQVPPGEHEVGGNEVDEKLAGEIVLGIIVLGERRWVNRPDPSQRYLAHEYFTPLNEQCM